MAAVEVAQTLEYKCGQLKCRSCTRAGKGSLKDIGLKMMEKAQELQKFLVVPVLLDDQMNSVINCLTAKSTWDDLILYHEGPSDVKESRVMDLKLCYNTFKSPSKAFQDSPDDEEDTRSSHEYLNDLEEEYQARALLAKSKRFFKKELRPTKDFEAKYNKVKAKLTLLSSSASASKASTVKNKAKKEPEMVNSEQIPSQKKRILGVDQLTKDPSSSGKKDLVFVKSSADDIKVSIPSVERPWLSEAEGFILSNHDTGRILPNESQRNITDPSVADCLDWDTFWGQNLSEGNEGALHLGLERPRVYSDRHLKIRIDAPGRCELNSKFVNNMLPEWGRFVTAVKLNRGLRDSNYDQLYGGFGEELLNMSRMIYQVKQGGLSATTATENGVALDEEQLLFLAGRQDNDVDEDVDAIYTVYDKAGPSYDSNILSEVHDHDHYQDVVCEHHEEHEMHDDVQPNYVVDSHADYTSNSNMIPYDQYVKDNAVPVVQSNVSFVTNDAYMMIYNDMCEPHAQSVSKTTRNIVVDNLLTAKLETYKEQVELYERRAKFQLIEREQKIDEQLRIVITNQKTLRRKNLKKETYSALTKEVKEMKEIFEELEVEVDQHVVDMKHDDIESKNLLIANDNLIADCLFKDVFHVATNSELNVSSFTEMHDAHTSLKARCLELEVELSISK
ncbi:hypothetical protein Tco_0329070 [Tanacetum coccineum]